MGRLARFIRFYTDEDEAVFKGVSGVEVRFDSQGNLILRASGRDLPRSETYEWVVTAGSDTETYTSTGPDLVFTAEETAEYMESGEITVQVTVMGIESGEFTVLLSSNVVGIAIVGIAIVA